MDIQNTLDKLRSIVSRFATANPRQGAFYAMCSRRVDANLQLWKTQLPTIKPFYAVKCNPEPLLLNHLYDNGVGFDCASEKELLVVKELSRGGSTQNIVYANPTKSARDLGAARELGAPVTVVDSVEELEKVEGYEGGALVRIAVDDTSSRMPFSTKFGCSLEDVDAIAVAAKSLRIPLRGISFHVGSSSTSTSAFGAAIRAAYYTGILKLRGAGHTDATILDIGGGFLPDETDFKRKAMCIRGTAMEIDWDDTGVRWIAEPGRFFATDSMDFFVQVIGKKSGGARQGWKYTLDDSLYGQFSSILFDYQTPLWVRVPVGLERKERSKSPGVLFGRTCDSVDVIARAEEMEELEVGDWLWFPRMGAYTRATATEFNGFPRPPIVETRGGLPDVETTLRSQEAWQLVPKGVTYMPPVSVRAFWTATMREGK